MDKEQQRDLIHDGAEKFAKIIEQTVGENTRVGIFYTYLDGEKNEWVSGDAGNMNWLERCGAAQYIADLEKQGEAAKDK